MSHITSTTQIAVLGGGAWGTALAILCANKGHKTCIWAREPEVVEGINGPEHENKTFLPGFKCPSSLTATCDMQAAVQGAELLLMVIPTPFVAATLAPIAGQLSPETVLVSCTKGILNDSLETVNEILERVLPPGQLSRVAYLSGPSFAAEVAQGHPTLVTIASKDEAVAERVQQVLSTPRFRCYRTTDVVGVELGGALKNVLAIACGVSDGLGFGHNARAALITRGLQEVTRLAVAKGAHPLTMAGLAGMGDLVLTCTGDLSRNRTVGLRLGRGEALGAIQASMSAVAEGVLTSKAAHQLAVQVGVQCPIIEGIYKVIHEGADPRQVVEQNMALPLKPELDRAIVESAAERPAPPAAANGSA